jgi:putative selenate reductase molybdopterin-binding subunit
MELELRINGIVESIDVAPNETLLSLLRRKGHCSVKQSCETGECGACTVLVEGVPRPGCVMLAAQAGGCSLTTVEGLGTTTRPHPLQTAFIEVGATQCGFCTSGMLLSAHALLVQNPQPGEADVRDALSGHHCRCTGYEKPVQAVLRAAAVLRGEEVTDPQYNTVSAIHEQGTASGKLLATLAASAAGASATMQLPAIKKVERAATVASPASELSVQPQFQVIGKPLPLLNARQIVSGKTPFVGDIQGQTVLYARLLTSPHAHAQIKHIDASAARALPGVHAVLTHHDVPRVAYSSVESAQPEAVTRDRYIFDPLLRYVGDRVAVVAAETSELAEQALGLIHVEYDVLPPILDPRHSSIPTAPRLHPESESYGIFDATRNIAARVNSEIGDVDQGFALADLVVEGEYIASPSHPAPSENHTVVTYFSDDDCLVVHTNCQAPHHVRHTLAQVLSLPQRRIRVLAPENSGDAARQEMLLEDLCALLSIATHRPVMLAHSRAEEFAARTRAPHILHLKTGVMRDGSIIASQIALLADTGAHATHPLITRLSAFVSALSLYPCPHMRFVGEVLYTNRAPAGAFYGNDLFAETFALESHIDEIAARLGIDALELRRKNWIKAGDSYPLLFDARLQKEAASRIESCGLSSCLQIIEENLRWSERRHGGMGMNGRFRRGVGVALSMLGNPGGQVQTSGAMTRLNEDGSFDLFVSAGAGAGAPTVFAQIAAEVLGVPLDYVLPHTGGTDATPFTLGTGDAALYSSGGAVRRAAEQIRRQVLAVAGRMLNALPEALKISNGSISVPDGPQVTIAQVATYALYQEGRQLMTTATWRVAATPATFAVQGVEVEVDTETGVVRVLNAISAVDVGRALNPALLEGQIQGSVVQALGAALSEELLYDQKGLLLSTNLSDYRVFTAPDMPATQVYLVETDDPFGPFGAKAASNIAFYGIAPAIANAIADALGIRMRQVPFSPERVLRAIHAHNARR